MDGVSISFDDFWFNVRPSNTEPVLRLRLEARTAAHCAGKDRRNHAHPGARKIAGVDPRRHFCYDFPGEEDT